MKCNMYFVLATTSIILIIGIAILILYKNMKDSNMKDSNMKDNNMKDNNMKDSKMKDSNMKDNNMKHNNSIILNEGFGVNDELQVIKNNLEINNQLTKLFAINPSIVESGPVDSIAINNDFQDNVSKNIKNYTSNIVINAKQSVSTSSSLISKLSDLVTDLENNINNINKQKTYTNTYTNIKSLNNGMEMELVQSPNTFYTNPVNNARTPAYLLKLNNGCLSVGAHDYNVNKCDDKNVKQYFKMEHILNDDHYTKNIDSAVAFDKVDPNSISYPFAMVKSINNDNCLTNNHGSITVQPCYSFVAQRWMPM